MKTKRIIALLLSIFLLIAFAACGGNGGAAGGNNTGSAVKESSDTGTSDSGYTIGIVQYTEHQALNEARQGFVDALADAGYAEGGNVTFDYQNALADAESLETISQGFVDNGNDLILAIGTPAAKAAKNATTEIPIAATAVTDYVETGLVESNDVPGGNLTGTSDLNPVEEQMNLMLELCPDVQTVGILYTSGAENSILQVSPAKEFLEVRGIAVVEGAVTNSNDLQQVTDSLASQVDAIYIPTDNVIAVNMLIVEQVCREHGVPTFTGEENMVLKGGFATYSIDYYDLGYQTGEMAVQILEGADPSEMPIVFSDTYTYSLNGDEADELGIAIPDKYLGAIVYPGQGSRGVVTDEPEPSDATDTME